MRYYVLLLSLVLLPAVAQAEPFEVWEDTGIIYSRDLATGEELRLSSWDGGCSQPDVDGLRNAIWELLANPTLRTANSAQGKLVYRVWIGFFPSRATAEVFAREQNS